MKTETHGFILINNRIQNTPHFELCGQYKVVQRSARHYGIGIPFIQSLSMLPNSPDLLSRYTILCILAFDELPLRSNRALTVWYTKNFKVIGKLTTYEQIEAASNEHIFDFDRFGRVQKQLTADIKNGKLSYAHFEYAFDEDLLPSKILTNSSEMQFKYFANGDIEKSIRKSSGDIVETFDVEKLMTKENTPYQTDVTVRKSKFNEMWRTVEKLHDIYGRLIELNIRTERTDTVTTEEHVNLSYVNGTTLVTDARSTMSLNNMFAVAYNDKLNAVSFTMPNAYIVLENASIMPPNIMAFVSNAKMNCDYEAERVIADAIIDGKPGRIIVRLYEDCTKCDVVAICNDYSHNCISLAYRYDATHADLAVAHALDSKRVSNSDIVLVYRTLKF
jgi:hypothetical protein